MQMEVGQAERWRVVNASIREHPMHLHGFYFSVLGRGDAAVDTLYSQEDERLVVTETMHAGTTMLMEWTPTRPGRWLFHCHLSFHVAANNRLPGAAEADPEHAHAHMSGLVMGL
jgi:FtsP/CotA-like multicopper oxidase with cupredoxin domain